MDGQWRRRSTSVATQSHHEDVLAKSKREWILVSENEKATSSGQIPLLVANAGCSGAGEPFPNPEDCGSFLQCEASGVAAVKQCPANLHFNAELKVCDYSWSANCKEEDSSSADSSSQEGDDSSSEEADKLNAKVIKKVLVANAGCSGAGEPFPNPDDCGSFLQCEASGVAAVKQCPANLHFNAVLKVCDYPWSANCKEADSSSGDSSSQEDDDSSSEEADKAVAKVSKKLESGAPAKKPKAIALHA
ncbi:protein obstructor-E-like [Schistocerca piceifrons]|uniref:protein obstructor-E-like n=1 Tax=Schistocerca piceifrons TaxID=274613 RepID=UPI001F5F7926|nr:protein obstructor-E-like [Schistocerca piceifrons]